MSHGNFPGLAFGSIPVLVVLFILLSFSPIYIVRAFFLNLTILQYQSCVFHFTAPSNVLKWPNFNVLEHKISMHLNLPMFPNQSNLFVQLICFVRSSTSMTFFSSSPSWLVSVLSSYLSRLVSIHICKRQSETKIFSFFMSSIWLN